ncbi:pentapeptide repeat-containing protein, partial [Streptomyces sp. B1866]|uniref:pentapeptide repeat-containing protein n=1 Tax=Streptomyces sp. B1866 TaxID=3075431 RepID=UPI002891A2C9
MSERSPVPSPGAAPPGLRADCAGCLGLCCVALPFAASSDFALAKDAGRPCPNLGADLRCGIHARLRQEGFTGCAVFDCFGAGQKISQVTFAGRDWRQDPDTAREMFAAFPVMRQLHELLWYLTQALALRPARPLHGELRRALHATERLTLGDARQLAELDLAAHREGVAALLSRASALVRATAPAPPGRGRPRVRRRADLAGADLRRADLRGADLR